jgi:signal transduction histidine kinase
MNKPLIVITLALSVLALAAGGTALGFNLTGSNNAGFSTIEETNDQVIVAATRVAAGGLSEMLKGVQDETSRTALIRRFIEPIRFFGDDSGYYFVYDYNCNNIAIAVFSDLQGKNLIDLKDPRGTYMIRELAEAAKNGGGFVEYYWPHPLTKNDMRKISYVEPVPGTNYFIGTGYYPEAPPANGPKPMQPPNPTALPGTGMCG